MDAVASGDRGREKEGAEEEEEETGNVPDQMLHGFRERRASMQTNHGVEDCSNPNRHGQSILALARPVLKELPGAMDVKLFGWRRWLPSNLPSADDFLARVCLRRRFRATMTGTEDLVTR